MMVVSSSAADIKGTHIISVEHVSVAIKKVGLAYYLIEEILN